MTYYHTYLDDSYGWQPLRQPCSWSNIGTRIPEVFGKGACGKSDGSGNSGGYGAYFDYSMDGGYHGGYDDPPFGKGGGGRSGGSGRRGGYGTHLDHGMDGGYCGGHVIPPFWKGGGYDMGGVAKGMPGSGNCMMNSGKGKDDFGNGGFDTGFLPSFDNRYLRNGGFGKGKGLGMDGGHRGGHEFPVFFTGDGYDMGGADKGVGDAGRGAGLRESGLQKGGQPRPEQALGYVPYLVTELHICRTACDRLRRFKELAIDIEGVDLCRTGRISIVQVCTRGDPNVLLFDITRLGRGAFDAGLRDLFQDEGIQKVIFDGRADNNALHHLYNASMANVFDVQVLHALLFSCSSDNYVKGFDKCRKEAGIMPARELKELADIKEQGLALFAPDHGGSYAVWEQRPLHPLLLEYCVADVAHLFLLKDAWHEDALGDTVRRLAKERIRGAISGDRLPKGRHMAVRDFPLDRALLGPVLP